MAVPFKNSVPVSLNVIWSMWLSSTSNSFLHVLDEAKVIWQLNLCVRYKKEQSFIVNSYTERLKMFVWWEIYSIVQKGHKSKPE